MNGYNLLKGGGGGIGSHGAEGNGGGGKLKGNPGIAPPGTEVFDASPFGWADVLLPEENTRILK